MRLRHPNGAGRRPGKILVLFALVLTVLFGMIGLVLDGGLLMARHREAQNASDAASLAAAMELYRGGSRDAAIAKAREYVRTYNNLASLTDEQIDVRIPPTTGPYAGSTKHVEVVLTQPVTSYLIQILGLGSSRDVSARAVAGYETGGKAEGAIVLDPRADSFSGLSVQGGSIMKVGGAIIVNSQGKGIDQWGAPVPSTYNQYAVATGNNGAIYTDMLMVAGGVDTLNNIYNTLDWPGTTHNADNPLYARATVAPDPLAELPIPQQSQPGVVRDGAGNVIPAGAKGSYAIGQGQTAVFSPGVYNDIQIGNGATVTFSPGIYVLSPQAPNQGLKMTNAPTVTATGALFYFTGSNYLANPGSPGLYDIQDGPTQGTSLTTGIPQPPPDPQFNQVNFAMLDLNTTGGVVNLSGYSNAANASDPLNGLLFYFRRRMDGRVAQIQGNPGAQVHLTGGIYTKWGNFKLSGGGTYEAQFIVGSMDVAGGAVVTILGTGKQFGLADLVYLVE